MKRKVIWEIAYAAHGGNQMLVLLAAGWEPFAVTPGPDPYATAPAFIWFRRKAGL